MGKKNIEGTIKDFKKELKELMAKYNFGKMECEKYNGEDVYCGIDEYFTINNGDETWYRETISEILDEYII